MKKREKKSGFLQSAGYWMNEHISKGVKQQFLMLLVFIAFVIILFGVVAVILNAVSNVNEGFWQSFIHLLDPGTVSGNDFNNIPLLILMVIVTLIGMVFTGLLISIINNALEQKLSDLRRGRTPIVEKGHMVILGCNTNTYTILSEQILTNLDMNKKQKESRRAVVVVADPRDKEEMERDIFAHCDQLNNTKLICRSGELTQEPFLATLALEKADSIVICGENDTTTLKQILALGNYLRGITCRKPKIVAQFHDPKVLSSAQVAMEDFNANLLYCEDILSRITAQVCRQPGLSYVLQDLFNYQGNEIYIESADARGQKYDFNGQLFADILNQVDNGTVIGIRRWNADKQKNDIIIDPETELRMQSGDELILISEDAGCAVLHETACSDDLAEIVKKVSPIQTEKISIIVLGWNRKLPAILKYLNDFVAPGSTAEIYAEQEISIDTEFADAICNMTIRAIHSNQLEDPIFLRNLLDSDVTNFLLLCEDSIDQADADTNTIIRLLHLRDQIEKMEKVCGQKTNVIFTSELDNPDNQKLMKIARVNDFIVGSEFTNRVLTQVANCPDLEEVFTELLTAYGAEIYLRPVDAYIDISKERSVSFADLTKVCYERRDIVLGWMSFDENGQLHRTLNPPKAQKHIFLPGEELIVISQG